MGTDTAVPCRVGRITLLGEYQASMGRGGHSVLIGVLSTCWLVVVKIVFRPPETEAAIHA